MMCRSRLWLLAWMLSSLVLAASAARAGYSFEAPPSHPDWEPGIEAIQRRDWTAAIAHLGQVVKNEPDNADAHNSLGFAYRNAGELDAAFKHYREALRRSPNHRSAHENIGEAWLAIGQKAKAREHLQALKKACGDCGEYQNLARAIAAAK